MENRSKIIPALTFLVLLTFPFPQVDSARILAVAFMSSRSHKITYEPLLDELAVRGHQLTIVAPFISGKQRQNVREIRTLDLDAYYERAGLPNMFEMKEKNEQVNPFLMARVFGGVCRETFDQPQVMAVLKEKFDLVIMSALFNECAAGFVHKLNTTLILISPSVVFPMLSSELGTPSPPSFVPNIFLKYGDSMKFTERVINLLVETAFRMVWSYHVEPIMEAIYREKLNDPSLPSSAEILRNTSLILSNSHVSLGMPRPFLPDIIEVGGMHCRPGKPLPKDLGEFLNSTGSDGFIYFSMGSTLKGSWMPEEKRKMFLNTFAKLKQKVLWKWETEKMDDLPKNVKLSKWVPQQDVLGHPNAKAFITHGGFGSTTEAVYHGVPLVGIPMFGDQIMNMEKAEATGYAVKIDYNDLTEEKLTALLNEVITQPKYRKRVQELSSLFRDQPDKPLDRAVFWTEYVLRHKGAMHLRSAARNLNFLQYHSIDVILFLVTVISLVLYIIFATLRFIVRKVCGGRTKARSSNIVNGSSKKRN